MQKHTTAYFSALTEKMKIGSGIMQIPARTPAMTAMTAVTLDQMSKGRFRLGLGVSGPQVVEGLSCFRTKHKCTFNNQRCQLAL